MIGTHAATLTLAGDESSGRSRLEALADGTAFGAPIGLAVYHLLCGDIDVAAHWIGRAVGQRYPGILFFVYLIGGPLRASPRWPGLAAMMNLPV